ncbi:MAG TPA: methyltransferase domain-containing protein [Novosphingobium sp.]|nr:methyltransferase domain-containing protein [Novosphingobium sp.]
MATRTEWESGVGRNWAAESARTDRSFAALTPTLLDRIGRESGRSIVDIGCGAGEVALAVAAARPRARVLGIDISPDLVAAASMRGGRVANCSFALADATDWTPDRGAPDLYVSRHGVMFFDDPVAAFMHLRAVAASDARLVFSCFRSPGENLWASEVARAVGAVPPAGADPHAPGPFAFADPDYVSRILASAGWRAFHAEPVDFTYLAGEGDAPVGDALSYLTRIGPAARALRDFSKADRAAAKQRLAALLAERCEGAAVAFPAAAWIVTASA